MLYYGSYRHKLRTCNTYCFFHGVSGHANALHCYVCTYVDCLVILWFFGVVTLCSLIDKILPHHIPYDHYRNIYRPEILESHAVLL